MSKFNPLQHVILEELGTKENLIASRIMIAHATCCTDQYTSYMPGTENNESNLESAGQVCKDVYLFVACVQPRVCKWIQQSSPCGVETHTGHCTLIHTAQACSQSAKYNNIFDSPWPLEARKVLALPMVLAFILCTYNVLLAGGS